MKYSVRLSAVFSFGEQILPPGDFINIFRISGRMVVGRVNNFAVSTFFKIISSLLITARLPLDFFLRFADRATQNIYLTI